MNNIVIKAGTVWAVNGDRRVGFDNLRDALDYLAKCCGFDCCENLARFPDQTSSDTHTLYFEAGALKTKNERTGEVRTVLAAPSEGG